MTGKCEKTLLTDFCMRLPYRVKVNAFSYVEPQILSLIDINNSKYELENGDSNNIFVKLGQIITSNIKPYLRPMSSMTEEERKEYYTFHYKFTLQTYEYQELNKETFSEYLNWLNKKMFDYRGLIEKGLALEAPKDMYGKEE